MTDTRTYYFYDLEKPPQKGIPTAPRPCRLTMKVTQQTDTSKSTYDRDYYLTLGERCQLYRTIPWTIYIMNWLIDLANKYQVMHRAGESNMTIRTKTFTHHSHDYSSTMSSPGYDRSTTHAISL